VLLLQGGVVPAATPKGDFEDVTCAQDASRPQDAICLQETKSTQGLPSNLGRKRHCPRCGAGFANAVQGHLTVNLSEQIANTPAQAEAAARTQVSDLLENIARDLTNAASDYGALGWQLAAILSEVDVPALTTPLTNHCIQTVAAAGKIARELQHAADEVRELAVSESVATTRRSAFVLVDGSGSI
jgi:hypothetical protein